MVKVAKLLRKIGSIRIPRKKFIRYKGLGQKRETKGQCEDSRQGMCYKILNDGEVIKMCQC